MTGHRDRSKALDAAGIEGRGGDAPADEIVRQSVAAFNRGDLNEWLESFDPESEIDWSGSRSPFSGHYRGREGLMEFWTTVRDAWDDFGPRIEEVIECGPERLITVNLIRGRGKTSGIEITARGAVLWTLRGGKIARSKLFQSKDEALAEVGASERDAPVDSA